MSRIGERIKQERMKQSISPKQLGKKCGVSESFIIDIESGKKIINEKLSEKIGKVLGVNFDENLVTEPKEEETIIRKEPKKQEIQLKGREFVEPLAPWEDALSGIVRKIPVFDIEMKNILEYRSFPIIDKKIEGYNPDKLLYISVPDDSLKEYRMMKGDRILVYLNQEVINHSFVLAAYDGKNRIRKLKRVDGNHLSFFTKENDPKAERVNAKEVKIIGRCVRVEFDLSR
ncbi:MAG: S24 family peptidase [Bacillota bacterium]